jgi:hypothetical protein
MGQGVQSADQNPTRHTPSGQGRRSTRRSGHVVLQCRQSVNQHRTGALIHSRLPAMLAITQPSARARTGSAPRLGQASNTAAREDNQSLRPPDHAGAAGSCRSSRLPYTGRSGQPAPIRLPPTRYPHVLRLDRTLAGPARGVPQSAPAQVVQGAIVLSALVQPPLPLSSCRDVAGAGVMLHPACCWVAIRARCRGGRKGEHGPAFLVAFCLPATRVMYGRRPSRGQPAPVFDMGGEV